MDSDSIYNYAKTIGSEKRMLTQFQEGIVEIKFLDASHTMAFQRQGSLLWIATEEDNTVVQNLGS